MNKKLKIILFSSLIVVAVGVTLIFLFHYKLCEKPLEFESDYISGKVRYIDPRLYDSPYDLHADSGKCPHQKGYPFIFTEKGYPILIDTGFGMSCITKNSSIKNNSKNIKEHFLPLILQDTQKIRKINWSFAEIPDIKLQDGSKLDNFFGSITEESTVPCVIGMNQLYEAVIVFQCDNNFFIYKNLPEEYKYKMLDIEQSKLKVLGHQYYVNLAIDGHTRKYFLDSGAGQPITMEKRDSVIFNSIYWWESEIQYIHSSRKSRMGMVSAYFPDGNSLMTVYLDYKCAINPALFFPVDIAIDFKNQAIYTKEPFNPELSTNWQIF